MSGKGPNVLGGPVPVSPGVSEGTYVVTDGAGKGGSNGGGNVYSYYWYTDYDGGVCC